MLKRNKAIWNYADSDAIETVTIVTLLKLLMTVTLKRNKAFRYGEDGDAEKETKFLKVWR
jgi:hypothetical protein